jgi:type I restriction enzyme, S subunit
MKQKFARLGDCCEIVSGSTPDTAMKNYWDGEIYWATPKDLSELNSAYLQTTQRKITKAGFDSCSTTILPVGSVLFSSRAPIGLVAINTVPMCTNQGFKNLVPKSDLVFNKYLYYWLKSNRKRLEALGKGATFKEISKSVISKVEIPLPPLSEQRRVAAILDKADALRGLRRRSIARLGALMKAAFLETFGDPVKNPKGWKKAPMGELMLIRRGGSPRPIEKFLGGSVNWIKIGDATQGNEIYLDACKEKITPEGLSKSVHLKAGSLIFANCGVSLGFARILKIDGCIHDGWLSFENIPDSKLNKLFLLKALNAATGHFRNIAPSGTQPNLNTGIMKSFEIILPPISLQEEFSAFIENAEGLRRHLLKSEAKFETLFNSIQQRAFTGGLFTE